MSVKSETVVDDWEGIDDTEVCTECRSICPSCNLNSRVNQLKKNATNTKATTGIESNRQFNVMLLNDDDCMRTQYVPPEPTVKILKRATNDKSNQQLSSEARPKAPIKSLQQREQEYAEARLRILGSAKSADEDDESATAVNKNGNFNVDTVNRLHDNQLNKQHYNRNNVSAIAFVGDTSKSFIRNFSPQQQLQQQQQHQQLQPIPYDLRRSEDNVGIILLPHGPDGTTGFVLKR